MPRWAAKVDGTQKAVVEALRAYGWTVVSLSRMGGGVPDLLIAKDGRTVLVEVKTKKGKLRFAQEAFLATWPGSWSILRSVQDVQDFDENVRNLPAMWSIMRGTGAH